VVTLTTNSTGYVQMHCILSSCMKVYLCYYYPFHEKSIENFENILRILNNSGFHGDLICLGI